MSAILNILNQHQSNNKNLCIAEVVEVDKDKRTCKVDTGEETFEQVRLQVDMNLKEGATIYPKVGSRVLIMFLDKITSYILMTTEIESYELNIHDGQIIMDKEGFVTIQRNGENLLDLLLALIAEVKKIIVVQGTSPDLGKLTELENKFKKVFKNNET